MRTLTIEQLEAELYDLHRERAARLRDEANEVSEHLARLRTLAALLNAHPAPWDWPEVE